MSTHAIVSALSALLVGVQMASVRASGNEGEPELPPIEAGQTWRYLAPPPEYGAVAQIQSVSGDSVLVAVRDLSADAGGESAFQLVRIQMRSLELSLDGLAEPTTESPSRSANAAYACGAQPLNQCLNTIHALRSLRVEDLYDR